MQVRSFQCGEHLIEVAVSGITVKAYRIDGLERTPISENKTPVELAASDPEDAFKRMCLYLKNKYGACEPVE